MKLFLRMLAPIILGMPLGFWAQEKPYFQQKVNTQIQVSLDDEMHALRGNIQLEYHNNAPDTLHYIFFHIYPNAYQNNHTAYAQQMMLNGDNAFMQLEPKDRGGIDSLQFSIDGQATQIQQTENIDVIKVLLPQPLLPGKSCSIQTPFRVIIPIMTSRLGHIGQSYQITQWFPKPAVYDKEGWHAFPYLNYGEYYSEYGNYKVSITVPSNYIVMATGNMKNEQEQKWLDSLSQQPFNTFPLKNTTTPSAKSTKTLVFEEENIHDFAWFADKNWIVRKETFTVPENGKDVTATACFYIDDTASNKLSVQYLKQAILGYSKFVGAYPYQTVKSVTGPLNAGGGMEYPTITIIDAFNNASAVEQVIVHEVGHNWFYGVLGNNERKYPFMDESINSYYEDRVIKHFAPKDTSKRMDIEESLNHAIIKQISTSNVSRPVCAHSTHYPEINYGADIYQKGAAYFKWLAGYMSEANFDRAMQHYYQQWQYKHPQPEDFYASLQATTDKPIDWFFNDAIMQSNLPNFKLKGNKQISNNKKVTISHKEIFAIPAGVLLFDEHNAATQTLWTPPFKGSYTMTIPDSLNVSKANLSIAIIDEQSYDNSTQKKWALKPFTGLSLKPTYNVYVSPAIGYNLYDGFMLGALVHNFTLPSKNLEYAIAPMYGFGAKKFAYTGLVNYFLRVNSNSIKDINFTWNSKKFSHYKYPNADYHTQYIKNKLGVNFKFQTPDEAFHLTKELSISYYNILNNSLSTRLDSNYNVIEVKKNGYKPKHYVVANYLIKDSRKFYPYSLNINATMGKSFGQLSVDGRYKINYRASKKGIDLRFFAAKLFQMGDQDIAANNYLNITGAGWNDYLYDHTFIGRNERSGFWGNQNTLSMGGFYTQTKMFANQVGLSNNFLMAINADIEIPKTPFSIFGNMAYIGKNTGPFQPEIDVLQYEAGIALHVTDRFTLALPIFLSNDLDNYRTFILGKNKILKSVAFRMDLTNLVPSRKTTKLIF